MMRFFKESPEQDGAAGDVFQGPVFNILVTLLAVSSVSFAIYMLAIEVMNELEKQKKSENADAVKPALEHSTSAGGRVVPVEEPVLRIMPNVAEAPTPAAEALEDADAVSSPRRSEDAGAKASTSRPRLLLNPATPPPRRAAPPPPSAEVSADAMPLRERSSSESSASSSSSSEAPPLRATIARTGTGANRPVLLPLAPRRASDVPAPGRRASFAPAQGFSRRASLQAPPRAPDVYGHGAQRRRLMPEGG